MANLSNINGKFVVEQTTGYVGIGITDPSQLLHLQSTADTILKIDNITSGTGKSYLLQSTTAGSFVIRDEDASSNRLLIDTSGNATFVGQVKVDSTNPIFLLNESDQTANNRLWGFQGQQTLLKIRAYPDDLSSAVDALTLTRTGNATFAGTVTAGRNLNLSSSDYTYLQGTHTGAGDGDYLMRTFGYGDSTFYGSFDILKHDTDDGELRLRQRIAGTATDVLSIVDGNATFAGDVTATANYSAGNSKIIYKAQRSGGAVAGDWSYDDATTDMSLGTSTAHSFSLKTGDTRALTLNSSQNATFAGDITSLGLTVDYTGNRTGDAGVLVTNDASDWGIKVDKDGTADYGILSQTDGENAIVVRNAAGVNKIQLQGDGDATFAGAGTFTATVTAPTFSGDLNGTINTVTTATTKGNSTNDTTVATTAFVQNVIGTIPAGLVFQGTWNASTNSPTLTSGSGTTGNFYIVSVAGSTNLDGITDWQVGDWAVFIEQGASDQWEKIDNSSVLDGIGTGGSVAGWAGSGTSNTLTNAPITFSGNNATCPGSITATNFITTTDTGISINGITMTRVAANSAIRVSNGLETLGLLRSYAGLIVGTSATIGSSTQGNTLTISSAQGSRNTRFLSAGNGGYVQYESANDGIYGYIGSGSHLLSPVVNDNDFVLRAQGEFAVSIGAAEKMRIDSVGNVGIGKAAQSDARLHTYRNSTDAYNIFESSTNRWVFGEAGGVCQVGGRYGHHSGIQINTVGNVGIGVTPESWGTSGDTEAIQISTMTSLSEAFDGTQLASNFYFDGTNDKYIQSDFATSYLQIDGSHRWRYAASGTADANITWSEAMRINSSGNVGIGTTNIGTQSNLYLGAINSSEGGQLTLQKATGGTLAAHIDAYTTGGNDYMRILSGGDTSTTAAPFVFDLTNVRVGIGTTNPQTTLEVNGAASALNAHFGQGANNSSGVYGGISLGYSEAANANYRKVGIVAQAKGDGAARQDLHFLVDTVADGQSAGIADSKMHIQYNTGDVIINNKVGIGTTTPGAKLEIAETAASTDCIVRIKATRDAYLQFSPANTTKWGLIADYPALGDFTTYNYPNNFNAIVCKDNKDITTNLSGGNFGIGTGTPTEGRLHVTQSYSAALRTGYFQSSAYSAPHVAYDSFAINQQDVPCLVLVETPAAAVSTHQKLTLAVGDNNAVIRTANTSGGMWFNVNGGISDSGYLTTSGTNALRLLNNGYAIFPVRVGIGTTTPNSKLTVSGPSTPSLANGENSIRIERHSSAAASPGVIGNGINFAQKWWSGSAGLQVTGGIYGIKNASNGTYGGGLAFYTQPSSATDMEQRMVIDTSGNVGIGTDSPSERLSVDGNAEILKGDDARVYIKDVGDSSTILLRSDGVNTSIGTDSNHDLQIQTNGSTKMYIESGGNVGIGTTSPSTLISNSSVRNAAASGLSTSLKGLNIEVPAGGNSQGYVASFANTQTASNNYNAGVLIEVGSTDTTTRLLSVESGGTNRFEVRGDGNVGIGTTTPGAKVDILGLDLNIGADNGAPTTRTNSTVKVGVITSPHYTTAEENFTGMLLVGNSTANEVVLGGGTSSYNSATQITFHTSSNTTTVLGTERMRIDSSGNVGINASASLRFNGAGDNTHAVGYDSTIDGSFLRGQLGMRFLTGTGGGSERMRITSAGNVGIGDTAPTSLSVNTSSLSVNSTRTDLSGALFQKSNGVIKFQQYWATVGIIADVSAGDYFWKLANVNKMGLDTGTGALTVVGDIVAYGSPSDKRLKENIKPIESALDKVSKLQGVTFDWKESDSILKIKEDIGFIAQDVQKVVPELVRENEDGMLSMRHQGIAPILLEAIKELKAEIEELKLNKCNCNCNK